MLMNRPVYLGLSILEISKIVVYEFWNDYVKQKCGEKAKLRYMETDSFIVYKKAEDIKSDIEKDAEAKSDTSNYESHRLLAKEKNKKVIN